MPIKMPPSDPGEGISVSIYEAQNRQRHSPRSMREETGKVK